MAAQVFIEPATQAEIIALRAAGAAFHAIAAQLNKRGLKGPQGGRWYGATIARVVHGRIKAGPHRCTARCLDEQRQCIHRDASATPPRKSS